MLGDARLQTILWTANLAAAERFYGGVLGLTCKARSDGAAVYDVGGADLRVSPVPSTQPSLHTVVGFAVPDVRAVLRQLRSHGIAFERFPGIAYDAEAVAVTPDGAHVAWLRDPDGNVLSIVQFAAGPATSSR